MEPEPPPPASPVPDVVQLPDASLVWLREQMEDLQSQVQAVASSLAHQQSVFIDIAGARTAQLQAALSEVEGCTTQLRSETERLRQLEDAIAHHLHDLVLDVVQPELRAQLGQQLPQLVAGAMAPELRRTLSDWLPQIVTDTVSPDVRQLLSEWLPVMVADTVQPEVRQAIAERLPEIAASAVQPELRRVLAERLPHLVAETVQPELRQTLADRLPHLVSETVRPEVRQTLDERLPGVVAQVVSPEVRRTLAERLPHLVADTVQPELRQVLSDRLPGIVAEAVSPAVGSLLLERLPGMLAETITPELATSLAEMEGSAAELRQEAAKIRGLREVVAERLPEAVLAVVEPHLQEVLAIRFPRMVGEVLDPLMREILGTQVPSLVAAAVQPDVSQQLGQQVPELVAETIRPELQQAVAEALQARLPAVVGESIGPELHHTLAESLPGIVNAVVTPQLIASVGERLPTLVGEVISPDLSVSLAEVEGCAAEMRAETARMRNLREALGERLPQTVMGVVETVLSQTLATQLPEVLAGIVQPVMADALATPLPSALADALEPALRVALARELPDLVARGLEREVQLGLGESLPALVSSATEPEVRRALAGVEESASRLRELRDEALTALSQVVREAGAAALAELTASSAELRAQADALRRLRLDVLGELPRLVEEAVAAPLAEFEASAAQLRGEAERLRNLRHEVLSELPKVTAEAVARPLAEFEASTAQLLSEVERLRSLRREMVSGLPQMAGEAVAGPPAQQARPAENENENENEKADAAVWGPSSPPQPASPPNPGPQAPAGDDVAPAPAPDAARDPWTASDWAAEWTPPAESPVPPEPKAPEPTGERPAPAKESVEEDLSVDPALAAALAPQRVPDGARAADAPAGEEESNASAFVLPGVVAGPSLARGIGEAVTRARLRRRRRRRAGPPAAGLHRRDPFAGELTRRLEWFTLARRQGGNGAEANDRHEPGTVAVGERDGVEVTLSLIESGGLCLLGPRAREAARAVVLTLLAEHGPEAARAIVVGDLLPAATTFPGLGRTRDIGGVLGGLQAESSRRQRLLADAGVDHLVAYRAQRPEEPLPLILVAAAEMTTAEAGRLRLLLQEGRRLGIVGLVVDVPLDGVLTLRLQGAARVATQSDGAGGELVGTRLFTVEREPAAELLEVLASSRSDVDGESGPQPADEPFRVTPAPSPTITVSILGGYRIEANHREIRSGLRAKARELLAFYMLHPEGTTLEEATEALWPEADPRRGSEWFWTALGNLRSRLRSATENPELKVIEREGDRYRIEPVFDVDLWRFEAALAEAGASSGQPSWAEALQRAADLYVGELLAGSDWPWAEVPREDLRGRAVDVLVSMAATRLVAGDVRGALNALERAVEVDPLAEQLYRRIMRLHAKLARPDQADATFRTLQARLGEIALEPSPESEKLYGELCGTG